MFKDWSGAAPSVRKLRGSSADQLVQAQYGALAKQIPALYVVLSVNIATLAFTFYGSAPDYLTTVAPAVFLLLTGGRAIHWLRADVGRHVDIDRITREFARTTFLGVALSVVLAAWGIVLFGYGNAYQQSAVALFFWLSAVSAAFCLAPVPRAAIAVVVVSTVPVASTFIMSGEPVFVNMAVNFAVVSLLILQILPTYFRSFARIIKSRASLSERHRQAREDNRIVRRIAYTDPLTGLANRRMFEEHLSSMVEKSGTDPQPFAVGMIDLDGFKPINDLYGHAAGDAMLRQVARRLTASLGGNGLLARLGGDEFGIIATGIARDADALALGNKVCEAIRQPYEIDGSQALLSCSCGFSLFPTGGSDAERLVLSADNALYHAKRRARGNTEIFSMEIEKQIRERATMEQALRRAVADQAITLHFQPIFDLTTRKVVTVEALARWTDPDLGSISPDCFIPIAEQAGLIEEITDFLLRDAVSFAASWPADVSLSFNLSAVSIVKPSAGLDILAIVARAGLLPDRLQVEITETALMRDFEMARATIENLRRAGVAVALDDFGTGHSSLGYIRRITFDKIKIDKEFITDITVNRKSRHIIEAVIGMCRGLGIRCVAEGIEDEGQAAILMGHGCTLGQGYLLARPMPAADLAAFLGSRAAGDQLTA